MREIPGPRLAERTTLRLGGRAIAELVLETPEDALALDEHLKRLGGEPFIIGRGSNLLAGDGELSLVLVRPQFNHGPEIIGEKRQAEGSRILVRVGAAVPLPRLLGFCARHGLSGLEGLVGIPGRSSHAWRKNQFPAYPARVSLKASGRFAPRPCAIAALWMTCSQPLPKN